MATVATIFDRFLAARGLEQAASRTRGMEQPEDLYAVPAFANEDLTFWMKRIDNTDILREADPAARRICWRMIGASFAVAIILIVFLMPTLYSLIAGYKLESLRQERQRLDLDRASLELQETKLLSPARLEELARIQRFVDPAPQRVVYLDSKSDRILARR